MRWLVASIALEACAPGGSGSEGSEGTDGTAGSGSTTTGASEGDTTQGSTDGSSSETSAPPGACVYQPGSCDPACLEDPVLDGLVRELLGLASEDVITPELAASLTYVGDGPETDVTSLGGLECFPNLATIAFRVDSFTSIAPLAGLEHLTDLIIEDVPVAELPPLAATSPTQIWLNRTEVQDVSALAGSSLEELRVNGSPIAELSVVVDLPSLVHLEASETLVTDLGPVAAAPSLTSAVLDGCGLSDVSPLFANAQLRVLGLRNNQITDLAPLGATLIEWLWIDGNPVSDLSPLASLSPLEYLTIADTQVTDLSPLQGLPIDSLALDRIPLADPQQLWMLPDLRWVSASGVGLASLDGIPPAMQTLLVADNALTDVSPLVGLADLVELDLASNDITDLGAIETAPIFSGACNLLWVTDNPLDAYSTGTVLPALCEAQIIVESDTLTCDQLDACGPID